MTVADWRWCSASSVKFSKIVFLTSHDDGDYRTDVHSTHSLQHTHCADITRSIVSDRHHECTRCAFPFDAPQPRVAGNMHQTFWTSDANPKLCTAEPKHKLFSPLLLLLPFYRFQFVCAVCSPNCECSLRLFVVGFEASVASSFSHWRKTSFSKLQQFRYL